MASFVLPATLAWANPQGQQVVRGSATFNTNGNTLTVTNTPGAAINWQSFSIKANETTHFQQANSASSVLNRVVQNNPSEIMGRLTSNGKVVLVNPFGITVGKGAAVDTAGFTASTLNISDADWAQGKLRFQGNSLSGDVKVDGVIRSANGDVMLFAPNVTVGSEALVKADNGHVVLGAGQKVEVTGRGLEGIRFEIQSADNKAVNLGRIEGNAVGIFAGTLRHSGSITAQTATLEGGKVVLRAIKDVEISGPAAVIRADGAAGKPGGQISISSASGDVKIGTGATLSANGGAGAAGGSVGISADAGRLVVEHGTQVSADGFPGGSVRLFGASEARVAGVVTAASPVRTDSSTHIEPISLAKGGKVEVLGEQVSLQAGAQVDVSGDGGGGTILVGGDFQGKNAEVPNAKTTDVAPGVILTADGRVEGDGGKVIVWADNDTHFAGTLSAQGGLLGGNGGFAETSGKQNLYFRGRANLAAPRGRTGTLLLDPDTIAIFGGTADGNDLPDGSSLTIDSGGLGTISIGSFPSFFTVYESELENTNANIVLQATSKIFVTGTFNGGDIALLNNNSLSLEVTSASSTGHGVDLTSSNHGAGLVVRTSGSGSITISTDGASPNGSVALSSLVTAGGDIKVSAAGTISNAGGITVGGGGSVSLTSSGGLTAGSISTGGGDVHLKAKDAGDVFITGPISTLGGDVKASGANVLLQSGGTGNINAGAGGVEIEATGTIGRAHIDFGLSLTGGSVSIAANRLWIDSGAGTITGFSQVELKPYIAGRGIEIGGDDVNNTSFFGVTQAEIGHISTPLLRIGSLSNTGDITITQAVSLLTPGGTLALATGGSISQGVLLPINASALVARGADVFLSSQNLVNTFAGQASNGGLYYRSAGSFVVGVLDGITTTSAQGGGLTLITTTTGASLNLASNLATTGGNISLSSDHVVLGAGIVMIDTNTTTVGNAGSLFFSGDLSSPAGGRKLIIDASAEEAGKNGGDVSIGALGNFSGTYLNFLGINAQSGAGGMQGTVSLTGGNLSLAATGTAQANQATLSIGNAFVKLLADTTINTNATGATFASYGGLIDLSTSTLGSDGNHRALTLLANNGAGGQGGTIKLGAATSFGTSSSHLGALTASVQGSGGSIHLYGDITTDGWSTGSASGNIVLSAYEGLLLHAPSTTLRTSGSEDVSTAGSVTISTLGTLGIAASAIGSTLTIDTSPMASFSSSAGDITLNTSVGNGNGSASYLQSLNLFATTPDGVNQGTVRLQGDILLDRGGPVTGAEASLSIAADKLQFTRLGSTTTLDTLQDSIGAGGSVTIIVPQINTSAGTTIRIDTSTSDNFAGRTGGNITVDGRISALGATSGAAPGGVLLDASGVALNDNGTISLSGDLLVTDGGSIDIKGATVLKDNITLGSASGIGSVDVTLSRFLDSDYNGRTLTIAGGSAGTIDLSAVTIGSGHMGSDPLGAADISGGVITLGAIHTFNTITAIGQSLAANDTLASLSGGDITLSGANGVTVASGVHISSVGSDGAETNGEQGGNIYIASSGGKVQIGANAQIFSQGGRGSDEFFSGGHATSGGDGGTVLISAKTTLSVAPGARIYSQGGEGGSGISSSYEGASGGDGGWGGNVSLTAATGQLTVDAGATIASYGGQGGSGADGGAGDLNSSMGDPGFSGYNGGHGGDGGVGGTVYLSALTANINGTLSSRGGMGGAGGAGGQGGQGGPGMTGDPDVNGGQGGVGGDGGAGGTGANGGNITVSMGSGTVNVSAVSTSGSGGLGGAAGPGGPGGVDGPVPGMPGDTGQAGTAGAGSFVGDISISSSGTLNLSGGMLSGRAVTVLANGNLDMHAGIQATDGDILVRANSGGRLAIGNFVSIQANGSVGVGDGGFDGGNITLTSATGDLQIGDNVSIQSLGGRGADRSSAGDFAYGGGRGGNIALQGATVSIGTGLQVLSEGGRGGDGLTTASDGTHGGGGGAGGNVSVFATSAPLVIPASATLTTRGGTGGNGSDGAPGLQGQALLDGLPGGFGGFGGSGGTAGTILITGATGVEVRGALLAIGGNGGHGGHGGTGGIGGDGSFETPSGNGGVGGDGGYEGAGGQGGYISVSSLGGTALLTGATLMSRGGQSGVGGAGGTGGAAGADLGGGSGVSGDDGVTQSAAPYYGLSGSIQVQATAVTIEDSLLQGSYVSVISTAGAVHLDAGAEIESTDGAFVLAQGGQLIMDADATIQISGYYSENTASLESDSGIVLASVSAPKMVIEAPTVSGAPGFMGIHLDGGTARFGHFQLSGVYGTYGNYGSSGDKLRVHLTAGSASGDLQAYVDRELWLDVTGDVSLGNVLAYTTGATGNIHVHGNGSIAVLSGTVGSDLGDNVGVFLGTSSGTISVGSNGDVSASGSGGINLATLDGSVEIDGYLFSDSGHVTLSAPTGSLTLGGIIHSNSGRFQLTGESISIDGELTGNYTGTGPGVVAVTDNFRVNAAGTLNAGSSGTIALLTQTAGKAIEVQTISAEVFPGPAYLFIEDIDRMQAKVLQIGDLNKTASSVTFGTDVNPGYGAPRHFVVAAQGNVTQAANTGLNLDGLAVLSNGAVLLGNVVNEVATVAGSSGGLFNVVSGSALTVGSVAGYEGIAGGAGVTLRSVNDTIVVNKAVDAGAGADDSVVRLTAANAVFIEAPVSGRQSGGVSIYIRADDFDASAAIDARGGDVAFNPHTNGVGVKLGGTLASGVFNVSTGASTQLTNVNTVRFGNEDDGSQFFFVEVDSNFNVGTSNLYLGAQHGVYANGAYGVKAQSLYVRGGWVDLSGNNTIGAGGVGGVASTESGSFNLRNVGDLWISTDGVYSADGNISLVSVGGSIRNTAASGGFEHQILADVGNVSLTADTGVGDSGAGGRLFVAAGGTVSVQAGAGDVWLEGPRLDGDPALRLGSIGTAGGNTSTVDIVSSSGIVVAASSVGNDNWTLQSTGASGSIVFGTAGYIEGVAVSLETDGAIAGPNPPGGAAIKASGALSLSGATIGADGAPIWIDAASTVSAGTGAGGVYLRTTGDVTLSNYSIAVPAGATLSLLSGGVLTVDGSLQTPMALTLGGAGGGSVVFNAGSGGTLTGQGYGLTLVGPVSTVSDYLFDGNVQHSGSWTVSAGRTEFRQASAVGTLGVSSGATLALGGAGITLGAESLGSQQGVLDLGAGNHLSLTGGDLHNQGTLQGAGQVSLLSGGTLINSGLLMPGTDGGAGSITVAGHLQQNSAGTIKLDWTSTGTDHIHVNGDFASGGTLSVGEVGSPFLLASDQFSAVYFQGSVTGGLPSIVSRSGDILFGGVFTAGAAGHLMISPVAITNVWIRDTNAAELWSAGANWSRAHAPTLGESVVVNVASNPTITVAGGAFGVGGLDLSEKLVLVSGASLELGANGMTVASGGALSLTGGSILGAGQLTIASGGTLLWSGGQLQGTGVVVAQSGATTTIQTGSGQTLGRNFYNDGLFDIGSSLYLDNVTLGNTGTVVVRGIGEVLAGTGTLSNQSGGTLAAGSGGTAAVIHAALSNVGEIQVAAGDLVLTQGSSGGFISVDSGRTLTLQGDFAGTSGSLSNGGGTVRLAPDFGTTLSFAGAYGEPLAGTLSVGGNGAVSFDTSVTTGHLVQDGGTVTGAGNITATSFTRSGGDLGGSGTLTTTGTAISSGGNLIGRDWNVQGTLKVTGGYVNLDGSTLTVDAAGLLDFQSSYFNGALWTLQGSGKLVNNGTVRNSFRSAVATDSLWLNVASIENNGRIEFGADGVDPVRKLVIEGNVTHGSGGTLAIAAGKLVQLTGVGTQSFAAGSSLVNSGTLLAAGGTVDVAGSYSGSGGVDVGSGGTLLFNTGGTVTLPALTLAGSIGGNDAITVSSIASLSGSILGGAGVFTIASGATASSATGMTVIDRTLRNDGTLNLTGGTVMLEGVMQLQNAGVLNHTGTATLQDQFSDAGPATLSNLSGGIYNYGASEVNGIEPLFANQAGATLNITSGQAVMAGGIVQQGSINVASGATLAMGPGVTLVNAAGGIISGTGRIDVSGTRLLNNGTLRPGGLGTIGTLNITGELDMGTGTVEAELASASVYDRIAVTGGITKGGTIAVAENTVFVAGGQSFDIITWTLGQTGTNPVASSLIGDVDFTTMQSGNTLSVYAGLVTNRWNVDSNGSWFTAGNWSRNHVPNALEDVVIERSSFAANVTVGAAGAQAASLLVTGDETLSISGAASSLSLGVSGGDLSHLVMTGGTLAGGPVTIGSSASFSGAARVDASLSTNGGTISESGLGMYLWGGGSFTNATVNLTGSGVFFAGGSYTFTDSSITATGNFFALNNNAHVTLAGASVLDSVSVEISGGGTPRLTLNNLTGANPVASFSMSAASGLLDGTALLDVMGDFTWNGGTMAGTGATRLNSVSTSGAIALVSPVTLNRSFVNQSSLSISGSGALTFGASGTLHNEAGATLAIAPGGSAVFTSATGAPLLLNDGFIFYDASGAPSQTSSMALTLQNNAGAELSIDAGRLNLTGTLATAANAGLIHLTDSLSMLSTGNRDLTNSSTGVISGFGTVSVGSGTLTNHGNISPGDASVIGTLTVAGNYAQGFTGDLYIRASGPATSDRLAVTGTASLDGILNVDQFGHTVGNGNSYTPLTAGSVSGSFAAVNFIPGGVTLTPAYSPGNVVLSASGGAPNVWIGTNGDWDDAGNWSLGHAPITGDVVIIDPASGAYTVTITSAAASLTGFTLSSSGNDDTLLFKSGSSLTLPSASTLAGTISITGGSLINLNAGQGAGTVVLSAGSLVNDGSMTISALTVSGGVLGGTGSVNLPGSFVWSGGTLSAAGGFMASGTVAISGGLHVLADTAFTVSAGTASWTGGSIDVSGTSGTLAIASGATFDVVTADSIATDLSGSGSFDAQAGSVLNLNAPTGSNSLYARNVLLGGTVNLLNGELDFDRQTGGSTIELTGTLNMSNGTRIKGYSTMGGPAVTVNFNPGALINVVSGAATLDINNWDLNVNTPMTLPTGLFVAQSGNTFTADANLIIDGPFTLSGGTLAGAGNVALGNAFNWGGGAVTGSGTLSSSGTSTLGNTVKLIGRQWDNSGSILIGAGTQLQLSSGAQLNNLASGTLTVSNAGAAGIGAGSGGGSVSNAGKLFLLGSTIATGGGGLSNSGSFSGTGFLDLAGTGTFSNTGTLAVAGAGSTGTLSVSGHANLLGGTWNVDLAGTSAYDRLAVTGNLTQGGTLNVAENTVFIGGGDGFTLATYGGTLAGAAPVLIDSVADVGFTLQSGSGTLKLVAATVSNQWADGVSGNWSSAANWSRGHVPTALEDALINPTGTQTVTLLSGAQAPRSLQLTGDDTLVIAGGSLTLGQASTVGSAASLVLSGGLLGGAGVIDVAGAFNWNGGTVTASALNVAGVLTIGNTSVKELSGTLSHSNSSGASSWIGGSNAAGGVIDILGGGRLINQAGARLTIATGGQSNRVGAYGTSPVGYFDNYGQLDVTGGGTFAISPSNYLNQPHQLRNFATGVITVTDSALYMDNDAASPQNQLGTWNFVGASGTASLQLYGTNRWDPGATITTSGATALSNNGTTQLHSAGAQSWSTVTLSGGSLAVNNTLTVTSQLNWNGGITASGGAAVTLASGASGTVTSAAASLSGGDLFINGSLGIGSGKATVGQSVTNAGTLSLAGGTLVAGPSLASSGLVTGSGTLQTSGTFSSTGFIKPGGTGATGTLTVQGNASLAGGTLVAELASTGSYDRLAVTGNLAQGGTISVTENAPFIAGGDSFDVVTYGGTLSGTAPVISGPGADVLMTLAAGAGKLQLVAASVLNRWVDGLSGDWGTGSNWTRGHAPNALEDAYINPTGVQSVTLSSGTQTPRSLQLVGDDSLLVSGGTLSLGQASTIASGATLLLAGGSLTGAGALDIDGAFVWTGGALSGAGTLGTAGASSLAGASHTLGRSWNNTGTVSWSAGSLTLNADLTNQAGGVFNVNLANPTHVLGGSGTLANQGGATIHVGGTNAVSALAAIVNDGAVVVDSGSLDLTQGATHNGSFIISAGAEVRLAGTGTHNFAAGSAIGGAGNFALLVDGPTAHIQGDFTPASFGLDNGTLSFAGAGVHSVGVASLNGGSLLLGGTLSAGTLAISPGSAAVARIGGSGTLDTSVLAIDTSETTTGYATLAPGVTVSATRGTFTGQSGRSGNDLVLDGALRIDGGAGQFLSVTDARVGGSGTLGVGGAGSLNLAGGSVIDVTLVQDAGGWLDFGAGSQVSLGGTGTQLNGVVNALTGSQVTLSASGLTQAASGSFYSAGTVSIEGGASFGGGLSVDAGIVRLDGPAVSFQGTSSLFVDPAAVFDVASGTHQIAGSLAVPGTLHVASGARVDLAGAASNTHFSTTSTGTLAIDAGGTLALVSGGTLSTASGTAASVSGAGTLLVAGGALQAASDVGVGVLRVTSGAVTATGANLLTGTLDLSGGSVTGNGDMTVTQAFSLGGGTLGTGFANLSITQQSGNLAVGSLGAVQTVTLAASAGSITDANGSGLNVSSGLVKLSAASGIDLDLQTPALDASLTGMGTVAVRNNGPLDLVALSAPAGGVTLSATGALTQSGAVQVMGPMTLATGGAAVTLTDPANQFDGTITLVGVGATQIVDTNGLGIEGGAASLLAQSHDVSIGALNVSGPLTIVATGQITQGAAFTVGGLTSLSAADILLGSTASTYGGGVSFDASGQVSLASASALVLAGTSSHAGGALTLTALGPVSQTAPVSVGGAASVTASGQSIDFGTQANDFASLSFDAASLAVRDLSGIVVNGTAAGLVAVSAVNDVSSSALTAGSLSVTLNGTGSAYMLGTNVSGAASFATAGPGSYQNISYNNATTSSTASVGGSLLATGTVDLQFKNVALALPQITAATVTAGAGGALTQTGPINAARSSFVAPTVQLTDAGNHLGELGLYGGSATVVDAGTVGLSGNLSGALSVSAAGITQSAGSTLATGSAQLMAAGDISLTGANTLGTLAASSGGAISVIDDGAALALGDVSASGALGIQSAGALTALAGTTLSGASAALFAESIGSAAQPVQFNASQAQMYAFAGDVHARSQQGFALEGLSATGNATVSSAGAMQVIGEVSVDGVLSLSAQGLSVGTDVFGGSATLNAGGGTLAIGGGSTAAGVFAANSVALIGNDIVIRGGTQPGASTEVFAEGGGVSINAAGNFVLQGGSGTQAYALVSSTGPVGITAGGTMAVQGGSAQGAYANVEAGALSQLSIAAQSVNLQGGDGVGAYAGIVTEGDITVAAASISLVGGSRTDADAVVVSYFGKATLPNCNGCVKLNVPPLNNGQIDVGVLGGDDYLAILTESLAPSSDLVLFTQVLEILSDNAADRRRQRRGDEIVVEGQGGSCVP